MSGGRRRFGTSPILLALPAWFWFAAFLIAPVAIVLAMSFAQRGIYGGVEYHFSFENYRRLGEALYGLIFWRSIWLALLTAVSCLLIGFPVAYAMATSSAKTRSMLMMLVILPFWTSFVIRTYAIKVVFAEDGPINRMLLSMGWIHDPFIFSGSAFAVWFGMVTNYLPLMILPLFVSLEKFDFSYVEAARDLGASRFRQLIHVLIPLNRAGIATGLIFVFAPALGEFVIPDLLGGARRVLIGNLITDQFLKSRDWPFGAALSVVLIVGVGLSLWLLAKIRGEGEQDSRRRVEEGARS